MRTIQDDFREFVHLDRKRTGDGITPREYQRWQILRHKLDEQFSAGPPAGERERRTSLRVPTRLVVTYDTGSGLEGVLSNLSRTGCFIRTDLPAAVGTRLDLRIQVEALPEPLEIEAEVVSTDVRCDGLGLGERGMGLRFLVLEPAAQKQLDQIYAAFEART